MKTVLYQLTPPTEGMTVRAVTFDSSALLLALIWDTPPLQQQASGLESTLEQLAGGEPPIALEPMPDPEDEPEPEEPEDDRRPKLSNRNPAVMLAQLEEARTKPAPPPRPAAPLPPHVQNVDNELERQGVTPSPIASAGTDAPVTLDPSDPNRPVDVDAMRSAPTKPENPVPAHGVEDIDALLGRQGHRPAPTSTAPQRPAWTPPAPNPHDPNAPEDIDALMGRKIVDLGVVAGVVDVDAALAGTGRPPQPHAEPAHIPAQPALPTDSEITQAHVAAKLARKELDCNCETPAPVAGASGKKVPCQKCGKWTENPTASEASP